MHQGARRALSHAPVAVGRAGDHALEEREHAAHALDPVERRDEVHLGGAGVGEAGVHAAGEQRADELFGAVQAQFTVAPVALTTLPHFSCSARMNTPRSRGLMVAASTPAATKLLRNSGSCR